MKNPIVFIHGLWLHRTSWQPWMDYFNKNGYETHNPPWPGDGDTVEASRANPKPIANHGVTEVADHFAKFVGTLKQPPILIGHSFGGLLVQNLLARNIAAAAIAIDPAPMQGVWQLPFSSLKSGLPVLSNPFNLTKAVSLTFNQFVYGFANNVPEKEAKELYDRYTIPAPGRPLFQVAFASMNPWAQTKINTANKTRGPLLFVSGDKDHVVPPIMVKAAKAKYNKSPAVTDFQSFAGRGHSLVIDHGWNEIAEYSLKWLEGKGL